MKRVGAVLVACAAACSSYGADDPDPARSAIVDAGAGADTSLENLDAGEGGSISLDNVGEDAATSDAIADATADQSGPLPDLYAFVTSTKMTGNIDFGTPEGVADKTCNDLALGRAKFRGRKFAAWIGVDQSPIDRIAKKAAGHRYILPNGDLVTSDPVTMASSALTNAIVFDERGIKVSVADHVWTGVPKAGAASSATCNLWGSGQNGTLGLVGLAGSASSWTDYAVDRCDTLNHLYCFEVP